MDLNLKNKIVVVTGASHGIGFAIAKEFLKEGAEVFISARKESELKEAEKTLSKFGKVHAVKTDCTKESEVENLAGIASKATGFIDVWVNNVGKNKMKQGEYYTESELDDLIYACYKSAVFGTQAAVKYMKEKGGSVVNISSLAARVATCGRSNVYASMKAALCAYTVICAGEYASKKIRVNAVLPGYTKTPLVEKGFSKEALEKLVKNNLMKRMASPEEIAMPVVFLSSEAASFITAECLEVTAGHNKVLNPEYSWEV